MFINDDNKSLGLYLLIQIPDIQLHNSYLSLNSCYYHQYGNCLHKNSFLYLNNNQLKKNINHYKSLTINASARICIWAIASFKYGSQKQRLSFRYHQFLNILQIAQSINSRKPWNWIYCRKSILTRYPSNAKLGIASSSNINAVFVYFRKTKAQLL